MSKCWNWSILLDGPAKKSLCTHCKFGDRSLPLHKKCQYDTQIDASVMVGFALLKHLVQMEWTYSYLNRIHTIPYHTIPYRTIPYHTHITFMHACMHTYITYITYITHITYITYIAYIHTLHTYIHTCMHACMHTYMHACIHTYIQTYTHTYIHTRWCPIVS